MDEVENVASIFMKPRDFVLAYLDEMLAQDSGGRRISWSVFECMDVLLRYYWTGSFTAVLELKAPFLESMHTFI